MQWFQNFQIFVLLFQCKHQIPFKSIVQIFLLNLQKDSFKSLNQPLKVFLYRVNLALALFQHYLFLLPFQLVNMSENLNVDSHFSRASPLNQQDSLLYGEKLVLEKSELPLILFYFKRENKTRKNTLKKSDRFWKNRSLKNLSLGPGIRLLIRKVPLKG